LSAQFADPKQRLYLIYIKTYHRGIGIVSALKRNKFVLNDISLIAEVPFEKVLIGVQIVLIKCISVLKVLIQEILDKFVNLFQGISGHLQRIVSQDFLTRIIKQLSLNILCESIIGLRL
jgi:hypothetical protein